MLWSDRGPQQASGSLRQALSDIRAEFGPEVDLLGSDRMNVWLDCSKLTTDLDSGAQCPEGQELLEGLDVRDAEFQAYLRNMRQRYQPMSGPSGAGGATGAVAAVPQAQAHPGIRGIRLRCVATNTGSRSAELAAQALADQIGRNIEDGLAAWRIDDEQAGDGNDDIQVSCEVATEAAHMLISVRVVHMRSHRLLFSGIRQRPIGVAELLSDDFVSEFAHDAASRSIQKLPLAIGLDLPEAIGAGFANLALRRLQSFDKVQISQADDLMRRAYDASQNGVYLGWRSFFRMAQVVEGHAKAEPVLLEEADAMSRQAVERAPDNAMALALSGLTRIMLFDDMETGFRLSEMALRCNPNSLFARQAYAVTCGALGQVDLAYSLSSFCQPALLNEDMRHLWDLYHSLVCISTGRFAEAYTAAKRASATCPEFLAPRRQLIGLAVKLGDLETARAQLAALEEREPGFSLDRLLTDQEYPASTLRRANLLEFSPSLLKE